MKMLFTAASLGASDFPVATSHSHTAGPVTRRRSQQQYLPAATAVVCVLILAGTLLLAGFIYYPQWMRLSDMKRDLIHEKSRLAQLRKLSTEREQEVRMLQNDPEYLEMIARDRLDLMKEGETIFRLSGNHPHS